MLSERANEWAKSDFAHGEQNTYDAVNNPAGIVNFGNAENVPLKLIFALTISIYLTTI